MTNGDLIEQAAIRSELRYGVYRNNPENLIADLARALEETTVERDECNRDYRTLKESVK